MATKTATVKTASVKPARLKTASAKTTDGGKIVETAQEARGAEPGPSVLALLTISTVAAAFVLGIVWFIFFRT